MPNALRDDAGQSPDWLPLFDGTTLRGWRGLGLSTVPSAHLVVDNGTIHKIPSGAVPVQADGQPRAGGDLMTDGSGS